MKQLLTLEQQEKSIKLLEESYDILFMINEEFGGIEIEIHDFLNDVEAKRDEPSPTIRVGKENCLNDVPILIEKSLPEITNLINEHFNNGNWSEMVNVVERLKMVTKDLENMAKELLGD